MGIFMPSETLLPDQPVLTDASEKNVPPFIPGIDPFTHAVTVREDSFIHNQKFA